MWRAGGPFPQREKATARLLSCSKAPVGCSCSGKSGKSTLSLCVGTPYLPFFWAYFTPTLNAHVCLRLQRGDQQGLAGVSTPRDWETPLERGFGNGDNVCLKDGSPQTIVRAATLRQKLQFQLCSSPSHSILTPGRPVPALTLERQAPGRVATGGPMCRLLV